MDEPVLDNDLRDRYFAVDCDLRAMSNTDKAAINKWFTKQKRWEKINAKLQELEEERLWKERSKELEIREMIMDEERWTDEYNKIIKKQENTIEWNIKRKCQNFTEECDSESLRLILTPDIRHYGYEECMLCHRYQGWVKYPNNLPQNKLFPWEKEQNE